MKPGVINASHVTQQPHIPHRSGPISYYPERHFRNYTETKGNYELHNEDILNCELTVAQTDTYHESQNDYDSNCDLTVPPTAIFVTKPEVKKLHLQHRPGMSASL